MLEPTPTPGEEPETSEKAKGNSNRGRVEHRTSGQDTPRPRSMKQNSPKRLPERLNPSKNASDPPGRQVYGEQYRRGMSKRSRRSNDRDGVSSASRPGVAATAGRG